MTKKQQEYNSLLKRIGNAENFLQDIDLLRAAGKVPREDMFYIKSYQKLIRMISIKMQELKKELGRELTTNEILRGF